MLYVSAIYVHLPSFADSQASVKERIQKLLGPRPEQEDEQLDLSGEVLKFPTNCSECNSPATTNMKVTSKFFFLRFKSVSKCPSIGHITVSLENKTFRVSPIVA